MDVEQAILEEERALDVEESHDRAMEADKAQDQSLSASASSEMTFIDDV